MDGARFDALSRAFAHVTDRRRALRGGAALVVGGAVVATSPDTAAARTCRPYGQKCLTGRQCCSGDCVTSRAVSRSRRNRCGCGDETLCGGVCYDTQADQQHCGACNNPCADGWTCTGGQCTCGGATSCGAGEVCCNDACVDTATDTAHCGGCNQPVPGGGRCLLGKSYTSCPLLDVPGGCAPNYACVLDEDGNQSYLGYTNAGAFGCANPGGAACPSGWICAVVIQQSFSPGEQIVRSGENYGQCFDLATPCTP